MWILLIDISIIYGHNTRIAIRNYPFYDSSDTIRSNQNPPVSHFSPLRYRLGVGAGFFTSTLNP